MPLFNKSSFCPGLTTIETSQVRQLRCTLSPMPSADGSALFQMGNTKVLASVYGPREVQKRSEALHDKCLMKCEYSVVRMRYI